MLAVEEATRLIYAHLLCPTWITPSGISRHIHARYTTHLPHPTRGGGSFIWMSEKRDRPSSLSQHRQECTEPASRHLRVVIALSSAHLINTLASSSVASGLNGLSPWLRLQPVRDD